MSCASVHIEEPLYTISGMIVAFYFGKPKEPQSGETISTIGKTTIENSDKPSEAESGINQIVKTMKTVILTVLLSCAAITGFAQTSSPTPGAGADLAAFAKDLTSGTNWSIQTGGGFSSSHGNALAYALVAYDFTANVGVIAGYDALYGKGSQQENAVSGGITLQTTMQPFAFVGSTFLTNIIAQPYVAILVATPKGGNSIGEVTETGANFEVYKFSRFSLDLNIGYQNRTGEGSFDGNYFTGGLGLTRRF